MILASGRVRPCRNAQDELHAADPSCHPLTNRTGYTFDAADQIFLAESMETCDPVRIVYHSHPNESAAFSELDHAAATFEAGPLHEGLMYLVVACPNGKAKRACLYEYHQGRYRETARYVLEPPGHPVIFQDT